MARTTINSLGVPAGTITAADLTFPLTDFSSTGIDDNATSTAITIDSSGNISVTGTVDGRDLATDGTKLDNIEANADVTDTTNVTAAGALMDSELTDLAGVKGVTISTLQPKPSEGAFADGDKTKLDGIAASATNYGDSDVASYLSTNGYGTSSSIIASITDSAPTTLDTLNELAAALGDDANFSTTVTNSIGTKWTQDNTKISNWDTAYSWGNHASAGYLTSYTETDTLNSVTGRGATTTNAVGTGKITVTTSQQNGLELDGSHSNGSYLYINGPVGNTWFGQNGSGLAAIWSDGSTQALTLAASTGNATFSGSVTATGASFTGDVSISTTSNIPLILKDSNATGNSAAIYMEYHDQTNTRVGYIGMGSSSNGDNYVYATNGSPHLYSGNSSAPKYNNNIIWHAGNDGSGSGLDADTLDGSHASSFASLSGATFTGIVTIDHNTSNMLHIRPTNGSPWAINIQRDDLGASRVYTHNYSSAGLGWVFEHMPYDYNGGSPGKLWGATNDGSGSGLDADLWDGNQFSSYLNQALLTTSSPTFSQINYNTSLYAYESSNYIGSDPRWNNSGYNANEGCHHIYATTGSGTQWGQTGLALYTGSHYNFLTTKSSDYNFYTNNNKMWHAGNDGSGSGLDADLLDGSHASSFMLSSGMPNNTDVYMNFRVMRNSNTSSSHDGMYIGYGNSNSGPTRIYGGGSTQAHLYIAGTGISFNGSNLWHTGNDGSGSGLDADTLDGQHASSLVGTHNGHNRAIQAEVGALHFYADGGDSNQSNHSYALFQEDGAWSNPYPDLRIAFHTGIKIGGHTNYDGTRFYTSDAMSTRVLQVNGANNYIYKDVWLHTDAGEGMYSSGNSAHLYPNTAGTYGTWAISGNRSSYGGFYDTYSSNNIGMYDSGGNGGAYRAGNRWITYYHVNNSCYGIGGSTTSSSYGLYEQMGGIYSTGNITAYSDRRVKENIIQIDSALDKVNKLEGVYYNKIDDETKTKEIGFIAQDVQEVVPELVTYAEDVDEYGVKYGNATALLVEAVKELTQKVKELEKKLEEK